MYYLLTSVDFADTMIILIMLGKRWQVFLLIVYIFRKYEFKFFEEGKNKEVKQMWLR